MSPMFNESALGQLAQYAADAAEAAGALIMGSAPAEGHQIEVQSKTGAAGLAAQVVTEVDLQSQELIRMLLAESMTRYGLGWLAEESADEGSRLQKEAFWCVDPLDGTLQFTRSEPGYAVSIGLVSRSGRSLLGCVYDAYAGVLYQAIAGGGAWRDGEPWRSAAGKGNGVFTILADGGCRRNPQWNAWQVRVQAWAANRGFSSVEIVEAGGSVMTACQIVERAPAAFCKLPTPERGGGCLWDFAATACLLREAGAWMSDCGGKPLELNRPDSLYMNECGVFLASSPQYKILLEEVPQT